MFQRPQRNYLARTCGFAIEVEPGFFRITTLALIIFASSVSADDAFKKLGVIKDKRITESSGLAISRTHKECLWVHNDSGDGPNLYLVNFNGKHEATVEVDDTKAIDWEDMCSFEADGRNWLLIADVGNNSYQRGKDGKRLCRLLLVEEPKLKLKGGKPKKKIKPHADIEFQYEDGRWNCEAVAVDVERGEILLVTKEFSFRCGVYRLPLSLTGGERSLTAKRIAAPSLTFATAVDISPSGNLAIVGFMGDAMMFRREGLETWADAFNKRGQVLELPERKQGETLCFDKAGQFVFVNSEGEDERLWKVTLPK